MSYLYDPRLERASLPRTADEAEQALRVRFRHAPPEFKARVDHDRAARGLPALWPAQASRRRSEAPASQPAARRPARVVCGVVAPHVSDAVLVADQPARVREWFDPACWSSALDRVKQGRHVRLLDRHGGVPLATTANGSLKLDLDARLGLTFVAELPDTVASRRVRETFGKYGAAVSVGFVALRTEQRRLLGREVRAVVEAALEHVALVGDGYRPAYPGANAVFSASADTADIRAALDEAKKRAYLRLASTR